MDPDLERTLEAVEKALGFKLFVWQKTYIERGYFRQYGATTAEILRELLNKTEAPLDYTKRPVSRMERLYRDELKGIKEKLDAAGIPTRPVFFTKQDKEKYLREKEEQNRDWEEILFIERLKERLPNCSKTEIEIALKDFYKGRNMEEIVNHLFYG